MARTPAPDWVPPSIDMTVPSVARIYDCLLGGSHNFAVDRETAASLERFEPHARAAARLQRAFMGRVVRYQVSQGVRQFLDIGSGIPTVGNVHEIAHQVDPSCRVVYVDFDPVAVAHSELMLRNTPGTGVVQADLRDPDAVLGSTAVRRLLDFSQPVGLLFMLVLHWIPGETRALADLLGHYRDPLAPGSHLALSHITRDGQEGRVDGVADVMRESRSADRFTARGYDEIITLFGEFELVEPGLVGCARWRPDGPGAVTEIPSINEYGYGGLARKP
ncbi:SAM-dependent methyltransferase [Allokutzneria sp. A3M-2-11 16]|uniref:SAM-dependent methyltransferase n=1 Tax=Allokutzneria sp. A3M-2-11 16 TaxID=2962043 RepID=UPI0020B70421|nr:SAM-dependent methyltransferase [Allokutzneria sp. A3M-2-11 16]MCP3798431.1 SAM-dependent methyltransferase [Allokutzneria sp. A3M-2-11 16]